MRTWLAAVVVMCLPVMAAAQGTSYPTKPVTIVVPAAPGGVTDALGRMLAQRFTEAWGQQVIVENKPGANNQIAAEYVTKAAPDGYTLLIGPEVTFVVNPSLYPKLAYDPVKGFTPISGLVTINHALIVNPSLPSESVKDLIALAKQKPGEINYGTFGVGSSGHLNMELFQALSGAKFQAVHYKGATPALTDVMAGHIQMMFISVGSAVPQWKADKVKFIAVGRRQAHGAAAGGADSGGKRAAGLRGGVVVRAVRAARNAGRDRGQDQRRGAKDLRRSRDQEELPRAAVFRIRSPARPSSSPTTSRPTSRSGAR